MIGTRRYVPSLLVLSTFAAIAIGAGKPARATSQNLDLDGKTANGSESNDSLTIVSTFPTTVKNKVTNKAIGDTFAFNWVSAGPGGFASSLPAGTSTGVGAAWTWTTSQTIFSFTGTTCTNDVCFTKTAGPDPVTGRGPFQAPGRSLSSSGVTVSNASLTSSLITFFSPPTVLATATSRVQPLGGGAFTYTTRIENKT